MGASRVPVDLLNPGQVFACLGFAEVTQVLFPNVLAGFDWREPGQVFFRFSSEECSDPGTEVLKFLCEAEVVAETPFGKNELPDKWAKALRGVNLRSAGESYPIKHPQSAATIPAVLVRDQDEIRLSHWGDDRRLCGLDNVKFWAGAGGYPGAKLLQDAIELLPAKVGTLKESPFDFPAEQSSSFRFDWRRDYIPMDIGFSLNAHDKSRYTTVGFPVVEVLAAIGVSYARPSRLESSNKLQYRYGVLGVDDSSLYPLSLLRASLGAPKNFPFPMRYFQMNLGWPGKEGQARCITTATEELNRE